MDKREQSIFDGLMLSDLGLSKSDRSKNARIATKVKYRDFAKSISNSLCSFSWPKLKPSKTRDKRTRKTYEGYHVRSRSCEDLTKEHERWYVDGKKIVPKDIELNEDCIMWWYLGDGTLHKKKSRPNYRRSGFATECFSQDEIHFLKDKLVEIVGEQVYVERKRNIFVAGKSLVKLAKLLGNKSPVECYQYKFDWVQYSDPEYFKKSYEERPINTINKYRKEHKVRELDYKKVKVYYGK